MVICQATFKNFLVSTNIMWVQLIYCISAYQRLINGFFHCRVSSIFQQRIFDNCLTLTSSSTPMDDLITDLLHVQMVYFTELWLTHYLNFYECLGRADLLEISILTGLIDKRLLENSFRRQQRFFFSRLLKLRCHD